MSCGRSPACRSTSDRLGIDRELIPYGNDPTRWVPELSALLIQTEGLISSQILEPLGSDGLEVSYAPFEGREPHVNLSDPRLRMPLDFWWVPPPRYVWLAGLSPWPSSRSRWRRRSASIC